MRSVFFLLYALLMVQDPNTPAQNSTGSNQDQMQRQMELAKPGKEHAELKGLVGKWDVRMLAGGRETGRGTAAASSIIGDRFLVVDGEVTSQGSASEFRFTIGFDRRHSEYEITLIDSAGTYSVSARGKREKDRIRMIGTDNDPYMKELGIDKKFAFDLELIENDHFSITTAYIDNRTEPEKIIPAFSYSFKRNK